MSSSHGSVEDAGQRRGVRKINEAVDDAQALVTHYMREKLRVAQSGEVFERTETHQELLIELHTATMLAFGRLRSYIMTDLEDEYWDTDEYDDLVVELDGDEMVGGLQILDEMDELVTYERESVGSRHGGRQKVDVPRLRLFDFGTYRTIVKLLDECRNKLGFGPAADKQTERTEIGEELTDEYGEWAKNIREQTDYEELMGDAAPGGGDE